ncbi:hypothetical protein GJAV_G00214430 [Gymnothorax javanicus]|nr:hypothetical protein GJAV_G00214430 [Gymnothorax javanicus]
MQKLRLVCNFKFRTTGHQQLPQPIHEELYRRDKQRKNDVEPFQKHQQQQPVHRITSTYGQLSRETWQTH